VNERDEDQSDLFDGPSDIDLMRLLLSDLNDDLPGKVARFRYLSDVSSDFGEHGIMLFGGTVSAAALGEARSSFVHGNFVAAILLCQTLAENVLAGVLHLRGTDIPERVAFRETLRHLEAGGVVTAKDLADLKKIADMRNPLSHFRPPSDAGNLTRRSMVSGEPTEEILSRDAHFAIATLMRLLSQPPFRVGR
jgi:hypothetical protein